MPEVRASVAVSGPAEAVLELWYDTRRWPAFVDGFKNVKRVDPAWPASGDVLWDSTPHGPGRTRETALGGGAVRVEDARMTGTRTVSFADDALHVTLEYELTAVNPIVGFFAKRALRDSLRRTLTRFARERQADLDLL
jgi:uncharacterized membrane protein